MLYDSRMKSRPKRPKDVPGTTAIPAVSSKYVAIYWGGLMIGRTPEYLGQKIEVREMWMSILTILTAGVVVLILSGLGGMTFTLSYLFQFMIEGHPGRRSSSGWCGA